MNDEAILNAIPFAVFRERFAFEDWNHRNHFVLMVQSQSYYINLKLKICLKIALYFLLYPLARICRVRSLIPAVWACRSVPNTVIPVAGSFEVQSATQYDERLLTVHGIALSQLVVVSWPSSRMAASVGRSWFVYVNLTPEFNDNFVFATLLTWISIINCIVPSIGKPTFGGYEKPT